MLLLSAFMLAAEPILPRSDPSPPLEVDGTLLTLDAALSGIADDPRVTSFERDAESAEAGASGTLRWLAPAVTFKAEGAASADPFLVGGGAAIPQDVVRRLAGAVDGSASWTSPVGTELGVGVGVRVTDSDDPYSSLKVVTNPRANISLSQHIMRGGGPGVLFSEFDAASAAADGASTLVDEQRRDLAANTAFAYISAMEAQARLAVRQRSVELGMESRALSEELVKGGIQSTADLLAADQGVAERRVGFARAERNVADARLALERARGSRTFSSAWRRVDALNDVVTWCVADFTTPAALEEAAVRFDPNLMRLAAQARALRARLRGTENAELPDVLVGVVGTTQGIAGSSNCAGGYARDGLTPCAPRPAYLGGPLDALGRATTAQLYSAGAFLSVSLPAWSEPLSAQSRTHRAALAAVTARSTERTRILHVELEAAAAQVALAKAVLTRAEAANTAAVAAVEAEAQKLKVGRSTVIDLLRIQDGLLAVADERIEALGQLARAIVAVRAATMQITKPGGERFACLIAPDRGS